MSLILEIVEGPGAGRQVPLDGQVEIGRAETENVVLKDMQASRRHASIEPAGGEAVVEDLGSLNGTFVNGNEIHSATTIAPGDHVLIGVTVFELRTRTQVAERPSAAKPIPPALAGTAPEGAEEEAVSPQPDARGNESPLDPLLDVRVKKQAGAAPLALFLLVVIVVSIFLATR